MAFRVRKSIKIAPGLRLTASRSGLSASIGPRGLSHSIGPGGRRTNLGLPGTGLSYSHKHTSPAPRRQVRAALPEPAAPQRDPLKLSLLDRLFRPATEKALIRALRALRAGDVETAQEQLASVGEGPDVSYLQAFLATMRKDADAAIRHFEAALAAPGLGQKLNPYGFAGTLQVAVTDELTVTARHDPAGVRFMLVEFYQARGEAGAARRHADALIDENPADLAPVISLAELILEQAEPDETDLHRVAELCAGHENEDAVSTVLYLYHARALARLGLEEATIDVLTKGLRRKKDRAPALLHQLAYDRAVLLEQTGKKARAKKELEKLYAADPGFADVATRLGIARPEPVAEG